MARHRRPKKKLSLHQRRVRAANRNPLYNPTQPLSGYNLRRAAGQLTDLQFGPQRSALDREQATATQQGGALQRNASDYYRQVATQEAAAVARQQALGGQTNAQLKQIGADTQAQIGQSSALENQTQARDAALRGGGLAGGGDTALADQLAARRAGAAQSAGTFRSAGALQGGNYQGLANSAAMSTAARGGEVQGQLANRLASTLGDIRSRRSALESSRGDALTKQITDLRTAGFDQIATMEGLGIKRDTLAATVADQRGRRAIARGQLHESSRHNRAMERLGQINSQLAKGNLDERTRHNLETEKQGVQKIVDAENKAGRGGKGSLTSSQRSRSRNTFDKAVGRVNLIGSGKDKTGRPNPPFSAKRANSYVNGLKAQGIPDLIARAAVSQRLHGFVPSHLRRQIRARFGFWAGKAPTHRTGKAISHGKPKIRF